MVAATAQAVSTPVRLTIVAMLEQREHGVAELAEKIGQSSANTSAQLKVLAAAGLVESHKEGRRVLYRLASPQVSRLVRVLQETTAERSTQMRELLQTYYHLPEALDRPSVRELRRRVKTGEILLLDLRPRDEFAAGHLEGATSVPLEELEGWLAELDDGVDLAVYCRGRFCVRAEEGTRRLHQSGHAARNLGAPPRAIAEQGFPWTQGE